MVSCEIERQLTGDAIRGRSIRVDRRRPVNFRTNVYHQFSANVYQGFSPKVYHFERVGETPFLGEM